MKYVVMNDELRGRVYRAFTALPPGELKRETSMFALSDAKKAPLTLFDRLGVGYEGLLLEEDLGTQPASEDVYKAYSRLMFASYKRNLPELAGRLNADDLNFRSKPDNLGVSYFSAFDVMISTLTFGVFGYVIAGNQERPQWQRLSWMTLFGLFGMCVDVALWTIKVRKVK